jgi:phage repressor protein C with HTH and peptisase S24 domain
MILQAVIFAASLAVVGTGAFFYGQKLEAEGWIEVVANLDSELNHLKTEGDSRAKRADERAGKAVAELAKVKKQAEADRAKADGIRADWIAYLDGRVPAPLPGATDEQIAIAACRADAAASRGALDRVLAAAFGIREVAVLNTEQLRQLQQWVTEASK